MTQVSHGVSGALRRFTDWGALGSVGYPMLEGSDCWDQLKASPSHMEICFATFENTLQLDDSGEPARI